jgi:AraC-like DNA-binding protein
VPATVVVRSSDLSETRAAVARHYYSNFVDLLDSSARLTTRMDVVRCGPLTVGDVSFGADVRIRLGELSAYHVDLPLSGQLIWWQGRAEPLVSSGATAAVFQPSGDTVLDRWSSDCRLLAVKIDRAALESRLAAMLDAPVNSPVRFGRQLDTASGAGRTWDRLIRVLVGDATGSAGLACHPLLADQFQETLLSGLLLATDHQYRERLDRLGQPAAAPRSVRRTVDAMEARPDRPYTLAALAAIAETSQRSLQKGFRRYIGLSPMAYLRQVRLARVRDELARATPAETTVTEVAVRWGFLHPGRFAAAYRRRFGTTPSQTLRRPATTTR